MESKINQEHDNSYYYFEITFDDILLKKMKREMIRLIVFSYN